MAKYITRRNIEKSITVKTFNKETEKVEVVTFTDCIGFSNDSEKLEKEVKKVFFKGNEKEIFLEILEINEIEHFYRMLETDFIKYAEEVK